MIARAGMTAAEALAKDAPLKGVSRAAYDRFEDALTIDFDRGPRHGKPRAFNAVTRSGLGCFGISPRRLVDIGVLEEVFVSRGKAIANPRDKRVVLFLADPILQREALVLSLKKYDAQLASTILPAGMTRSGALALHHRLGPDALAKWAKYQAPSTIALFRRTNGLF